MCLAEIFSVQATLGFADVPNDRIYFSQTGHLVSGPFLNYWQTRGGLSSYGYPITDVMQEGGLTVQYFERARFEYHPENAGSAYEVLLGHLGLQLTSTRDFPVVSAAAAAGGAIYFPQTQHTLGADFLDYWQGNGGLNRFGYPISEQFSETSTTDHRTYTVQYFERARFELHPDNNPPYRVLLGQLGKEMLALRSRAAHFVQAVDGQLAAGEDLAPLKLKGLNYFPRDFPWTDFGDWPPGRVDYDLAKAQQLGTNVLRVFVRYDAFDGAGANWSRQEGFASLVRTARAHGIYLLVSLFDGARKEPDPNWDNWPAPGTPEEAQDKAYLAAVVTPWKDDPTILAWDLYNEPDHVTGQEWQWDAHRDNRISWLARMASTLRTLDPNHLVTVGVALASSNLLPGMGGVSVLSLVDLVSVHYYTRNYGGESAADVLRGLKRATRKPLLVEEVGASTIDGPASEDAQARFLSSVLQDVNATNASGALVWTLYDFPAHFTNSEGYYGILRADESLKPAAAVFAGK